MMKAGLSTVAVLMFTGMLVGRSFRATQVFAAETSGTSGKAVVWSRVTEGPPAWRSGGVLVPLAGESKTLYFGGLAKKGLPYVQSFDAVAEKWSTHSEAAPGRGPTPLYRAAHDPVGGKVYCLTQVRWRSAFIFLPEGQLYAYDLKARTWTQHKPDPLLADMDWHVMALDSAGRTLVVVGADKQLGNVGWSRTVIYDIDAGQWRALPPPPADVVKKHTELVAARESLIDLIGRTRQAWFRDPKGIGTPTERKALTERCAKLGEMPSMASFKDALKHYHGLIASQKTLAALKVSRTLQMTIETRAEEQYPVPPSRQNSPLVYDAKNKVYVLFGGDHQDYHTNDTWILDLRKGWRRASPGKAPSPRAGHMLVHLPKSGKILLYGGYMQESSTAYCANASNAYEPISPRQVWVYDVATDRWDLLESWDPGPGGMPHPDATGYYYGYHANYSPVPLVPLADDSLLLAWKDGTWRMKIDAARLDAAGTARLGSTPNLRKFREGMFRAAYCEVSDPPPDTKLGSLPANRFVKLPTPPKNVCYGCRNRVWGTATWDSDREQILVWGGGHCVRSENPPIHYSPVSGRMVEGYDAQESYSQSGPRGTTTMNRPWVPGHSWNLYAYDPKCKMMVIQYGYLYDPDRMDWLRRRPVTPPFTHSYNAVLESTPHGVAVWARAKRGVRDCGLWLFDMKKREWTELLKPVAENPVASVDNTTMVYDSKRDRLLLMETPWQKPGDGTLHAFNFKDRTIEKLTPANLDFGKIRQAREMVYVDHADWVLFGWAYPSEEAKTKKYVRAYDGAKNRWILLDLDGFPTGGQRSHGWMYDAKRKLVYVVDCNKWGVWALRLDPKTVKIHTTKP